MILIYLHQVQEPTVVGCSKTPVSTPYRSREASQTPRYYLYVYRLWLRSIHPLLLSVKVANQPISTSQDHRIRRSPFWNGGFVPRSKIAVSNLFCHEGKLSTAESPRVMYLVRKAIPSIYFCHRYFGCRGKCDGGKHMACMCAATGHVISSLAESCMRS